MFHVGSWLYEVGQYLQASGVGTLGTTLFVGQFPNSPSNSTALVASGGQKQSEGVDPLYRPTLTILVRRTTKTEAENAATTIFNLLDTKWNILTTYKGRCVPDHLPGPNFLSESGHPIYSLNFSWTLGR